MSETLTQPGTKYTMTCKTSELNDAMKFLSIVVPKNKKGKLYSCEITIKTNEVNFVAIGATRVLYCKSTGPVKITIPFLYFYDIVKSIKTFSTQITIGDGLMAIGNLTVKVNTFFFQDDSILRSIQLPINYSIVDILRLSDRYTPEEIEFNKLDILLKRAFAELNKDISVSYGILKKYGVTTDEIRKIVLEEILNKQPKFN